MAKGATRKKKYDTEPLVDLIRFYVRKNGGIEALEKYTELKESTYYGRNRKPDEYHLGELRELMIAFNIPKDYILSALVTALDIPAECLASAATRSQAESGRP